MTAPIISLSFINWNSVDSVGQWVNVLDYSGAVDFLIAILGVIAIVKRLEGKPQRCFEWGVVILAAIAGTGWILDAKFNHRLSVLQQQETDAESKRNDIRGQRLNSITAFVSIRYKTPTNSERNDIFDTFLKMQAVERPALQLDFAHWTRFGGIALEEDPNVKTWRIGGEIIHTANFAWSGEMQDWNLKYLDRPLATVGNIADSMNGFSMGVPLPYKTEILGGSIVLSFNSQIRREIPIPHQILDFKPFVGDRGEFYTDTNLFHVWTNQVQNTPKNPI